MPHIARFFTHPINYFQIFWYNVKTEYELSPIYYFKLKNKKCFWIFQIELNVFQKLLMTVMSTNFRAVCTYVYKISPNLIYFSLKLFLKLGQQGLEKYLKKKKKKYSKLSFPNWWNAFSTELLIFPWIFNCNPLIFACKDNQLNKKLIFNWIVSNI